MIGKGKELFLLVLSIIFLLLLPASLGEVCIPVGDPAYGETAGIIYANMFVCPYSTDSDYFRECPTEIDYGRFYGGPPKYHLTFSTNEAYWADARKDALDNANTWGWTTSFTTKGVCYPGVEGKYTVWYQIATQIDPTKSPSDGYCYDTAHTVDWDKDPELYCSQGCVGKNVDWKSGLSCCGDDNLTSDDGADCLKQESITDLCIKTGNEWEWLSVIDSKAQIKPLTCADVSVLSDGSIFWRCCGEDTPNPSPQTQMVGNNFIKYVEKNNVPHGYICFNDSSGYKIAECAGAAHWSQAGILKNAGESLIADNQTYYCVLHREREDELAEWKIDLDDIGAENAEDCADALLPDGSSGGYVWTGTKCCSEADDDEEYYNDAEGYDEANTFSGGCWNKEYVKAGMPVPERAIIDIVNYRGVFEGCKVEEQEMLDLIDSHTGEQLMHNNEFCKVLDSARGPGRHLFCSFSGNWIEAEWREGEQLTVEMRTTEWDDSKGCCAPTQCWDGEECIDDQTNSSQPVTYHGYRCIGGEWSEAGEFKYTWDKSQMGYCLLESQCLVDPSPFAAVNCINNQEYYGRHYCENGDWTSRAKLVALALLKYVNIKSPRTYTLFCDTHENILNYYEYEIGGASVLNYMGNVQCQGRACVNEFCVLSYPDGIAIGVSLNEPIDSTKSFLRALNQSNTLCDDAQIADNRYHSCGNNIWYNYMQNAVIQLPTSDEFVEVDWMHDFISFIKNPFESIRNWIVPRTTGLEFFNQTSLFTKMYVDVHDEKRVFAFLEEDQTIYIDDFAVGNVDYLGLEYYGLDVTPCDLIRKYDPTISCTGDQTIFAQSRVGTESNLVDAWPDLTAKLRIR